MTLKLDLNVTPQTLLSQQDARCIVTLENGGTGPIALGMPPFDPTVPMIHVFNVQTGAEDAYRGRWERQRDQVDPVSMPAGAREDVEFRLNELVPQLPPGHYDIRVMWEYNGGAGRAESPFVRVQVLPTTPTSLNLVNAVAGRGRYKRGVWVNMAGDVNEPARIISSSFAFMVKGGVSEVLPVAECSRSCRPVVSTWAGDKSHPGQWIAWKDGQILNYLYVDRGNVGAKKSVSLPSGEMDLVQPLLAVSVGDATTVPEGGVLLCQGLAGGPEFQLHSLWLTEEGPKGLGAAGLPGPKPLWIMSHVRSKDQWLATYIQSDGAQLSLSLAPWPGFQTRLGGPLGLAQWPGEMIGAQATMGKDDLIIGGLLMWKIRDDGVRRLVLISWKVSPDNACDSQEQVIEWRPDAPVRDARIGIRDDGQTAVLVLDEDGAWHAFDGEEIQPIPEDFRYSKQPLELGFMNGGGKPVLIAGTVGFGFKVVGLDGSSLPTRYFP